MTTATAHSARPIALSVLPDHIPAALATRDRWMMWRLEPRDTGWTKVPFRCEGRGRASATDPATWAPFDAAVRAYRSGSFDGIGFALGDGVVGIDHDHAYDPSESTTTEAAARWQTLGAYRELSPSGSGIHDLVIGDLPDDPHRRGWGRRKGALEVYGGERYLTVTGRPLPGSPVDVPIVDPDCFARLYREVFSPPSSDSGRSTPPPGPVRQDDRKILTLARRARNSERFEALWHGDTSAHGGDDSAADLALVSMLAFYTQDADQIDRLFRGSGLMRPKWERPDYRARTIERAMQRSEFYQSSGRVLNMPGNRNGSSRQQSDDCHSGNQNTGETPSSTTAPPSESGPRKSQATQVVGLANTAGIDLWHTAAGDAHVTIEVNGHFEHHPIGSKSFREWLARRYWLEESRSIGSQALQDAISTLSGQARFEGAEHALVGRIAHDDGAIWIDLGDPDWRAVRIGNEGYTLVESADVPVKFRRGRSIQPLPVPVDGGSLDELRSLFRFDDDNWQMVVGCLVGAFQADGGRAHLELVGRQGSGKSTFARCFVSLVDPSEVPARSMPKDEEALLIAVQGRAVLALDNVSHLPPELSDAFCRVSTGGGLGRRQLYSDSDEVLLKVQMPLVWTGITPVTIDRPDLADRTVSVTIEPIEEADRQSERALTAAFDAMRPRLFGALCRAVSVALGRRDTLEMDNLPRLADFALWVEAAAPELGWEPGAFCEALGASRSNANALAVEGSPIGPLVVQFATQHRSWRGSASELLTLLRDLADDETRRLRRFPKQANHLSNYLRRLQPALTSLGVSVGFDRSRTGSQILIDLHEQSPPPVQAPRDEARF